MTLTCSTFLIAVLVCNKMHFDSFTGTPPTHLHSFLLSISLNGRATLTHFQLGFNLSVTFNKQCCQISWGQTLKFCETTATFTATIMD